MSAKKLSMIIAAVIPLLALAGCTRSEWLLSFYYNRLDDRLLDNYSDYAEFTHSQREWIGRSVEQFHFWHRRKIMPEYAALLGAAADKLRPPQVQVTMHDIEQWTAGVVDTMVRIHECSPITNAAPFFVTLSDGQVDQIEISLQEKIEDERERREQWREEDSIDRAYKWLSRLGLELTDRQKQAYRETYAEHNTLWAESIELEARWNSELITLLRIRDRPGIQEAIARHLYNHRGLVRRSHPEPYRENIERWQAYAVDLLNDLEPGQREHFVQTLDTHRRNLAAISQKGRRPENMPADGACGAPPGAAPDLSPAYRDARDRTPGGGRMAVE